MIPGRIKKACRNDAGRVSRVPRDAFPHELGTRTHSKKQIADALAIAPAESDLGTNPVRFEPQTNA